MIKVQYLIETSYATLRNPEIKNVFSFIAYKNSDIPEDLSGKFTLPVSYESTIGLVDVENTVCYDIVVEYEPRATSADDYVVRVKGRE